MLKRTPNLIFHHQKNLQRLLQPKNLIKENQKQNCDFSKTCKQIVELIIVEQIEVIFSPGNSLIVDV